MRNVKTVPCRTQEWDFCYNPYSVLLGFIDNKILLNVNKILLNVNKILLNMNILIFRLHYSTHQRFNSAFFYQT